MNDFMIAHVKWLENIITNWRKLSTEYEQRLHRKMNDFMIAHVKWLENEYKVKVIKKR